MMRNATSSWAAAVLIAALFLAAAGLTPGGTAEAQSHSATRSFSAASVAPGGRLEVSVSAEGYGAIGQVVETLPEGFVFQGSDQPQGTVTVDGRKVAFTLFTSSSFTYAVSAPMREGRYAFTGTIKDQSRREQPVTGAASVLVGPPPTRGPTHTPTPTPTPEPTPTPTRTPAPEPTATPTATPEPAATPTPTPTRRPTATVPATAPPGATSTRRPTATVPATATPTPRAIPTRRPAATATPVPTATPEPTPLAALSSGSTTGGRGAPPPAPPDDDNGDLPAWAIAAIVGGIAALFVAGLAVIYVMARRRREERWYRGRW